MALFKSNHNNFTNNSIENSRNYGIDMVSSNRNILDSNTIEKSRLNGLMAWHCNNNTFSNNIIRFNYEDGMWIYYSDNNTIQSNYFIMNRWNAIDIVYSYYNILKENIFYAHPDNAIGSYYSGDNKICNNTFLQNGIGIYIYLSGFNEICFNNFMESYSAYGHAIFYSSVYNNWHDNYWDDWIGVRRGIIGRSRILGKIPKVIPGEMERNYLKPIRWYNFDWKCSREPYDYIFDYDGNFDYYFGINSEVLNNE